MKKVWSYVLFLTLGLIVSQWANLDLYRRWIYVADTICLAYIMIEVGLEFHVDKSRLSSYGKDILIALTAALCPWLLCFLYFLALSSMALKESLLLAGFAAPTSAGVLITLLAAAGLGTTWVFRKARILAIFDDLDTLILLIPLEILLIGFSPRALYSIVIILILLWVAYRHLHRWTLPLNPFAIFGYGLIISAICFALGYYLHIELEVLLPAFCFGCTLSCALHPELELTQREIAPLGLSFDYIVKALFMFCVGLSIPRIDLTEIQPWRLLVDVTILTLLMNLGKSFVLLCYGKEANWNGRIALCISMFPRAEVGAGVLFLGLKYGISGEMVTAAGLALGLNILLTGLFITIVKRLLQRELKNP